MPSIQELFALDGRVAIVTGGSRGLGEEMAEGLAEAGAALMICARRKEWLTPTLERFAARGFRVEGLVADVSKSAEVQGVVDRTMAVYGRLDILVNNAGITWGARPEDMPLDRWQKVIDVNLTGAFMFAQAAGRVMLKHEYGRIINISSIAGLHAAVNGPHYAAYAASKAGLMGLTRELAASWGRAQHPRQRDCPGILPFPARRSGAARSWNRPSRRRADSPHRGGRRAEGGLRLPGVRRLQLHHRSDDRRRRGADDCGVILRFAGSRVRGFGECLEPQPQLGAARSRRGNTSSAHATATTMTVASMPASNGAPAPRKTAFGFR